MVIDIPVIKDLALTASVGVAVLILTNLILLPVLLSYVGVSASAAAQPARRRADAARHRSPVAVARRFVERRCALGAIAVAAC
jgi:predicted RND superfamily exporter protein